MLAGLESNQIQGRTVELKVRKTDQQPKVRLKCARTPILWLIHIKSFTFPGVPFGMFLRGFCASPTVTPTSSLPINAKTACERQIKKGYRLPITITDLKRVS